MLFDIAHVPFSRAGRFLTLSVMEGALYLRSVKGGDLRESQGRLCRIGFADGAGQEVKPKFALTPDRLSARTPEGLAEFTIGTGERLHLRGTGLTVTFHLEGSRYDYAYATPQRDHCLVAAYENTRLIPRASKRGVDVSGQWRRDRADNVICTFAGDSGFDGTIDLFTALPPDPATESFDQANAGAKADFARWLSHSPEGHAEGAEARNLAAYLLWANIVPAEGALTRPAIFMSKNHMINIWSWDNAFSALGVAAMDEALAFDQFAAIFDHQHASGLLPDFVNDRDVSFAFTKPPVHGWALLRLIEAHPGFLTDDRRHYLAHHLARQVDYWLTHARKDATGLPAYAHGNDSGWDNASFFAEGGPVITPDLPTFLILACDCLAVMHADEPSVSRDWKVAGDALSNLLLTQLWAGETFGTRLASAPENLRKGQSLIQFMPLLLGPRLPQDMARKLIQGLQSGGFLTAWGPATESPSSPFYEPDGYWRGPIWAPTTCLIWDGLRQQGANDLAQNIARRFCTLCETSGMAENFEAISGAGLRDRAFAWTSAVYLLLAASLQGASPNRGSAHE